MEEETRPLDAYRVLNIRPDAHQAVIRAAFHALSGLYHPDVDSSPEADARMAEINRAYEQVRTPDGRAALDRLEAMSASTPPVPAAPPDAPVSTREAVGAQSPLARRARSARAGAEESATIDFGRYNGWTLAELAKHDPDYLRWLLRHTSGLRYRREIGERLAAGAAASAPSPKPKARSGWSRLGL
jgi:curved DNA-binding protein CbpA